MRTSLVALIVTIWLATPSGVGACGDKFLLIANGMPYGRVYRSVFPGSIVMYVGSQANSQQEKLALHLQRAGHRVAIVTTENAFAQTLQAGRTDIVIADVSMKSGLDSKIAAAPLRPTMLYVVNESNKQRAAQLKREVPDAIKATDKANSFLGHIEDTMRARNKAGVRAK